MPFHWPFFFSFQNFVQIISNLLAEENRDKWEEAQLVRLPAWGAAGRRTRRALGFKSQMGLSQEVTQPSEPRRSHPSDDRPTARGSGRGLRKCVGRRVQAGTWQSLLIWRERSASPQH